MSSGQYVTSFDLYRNCQVESIEGTDCTFQGDVEVFYDRETEMVWWDCPLCGEEHVDE